MYTDFLKTRFVYLIIYYTFITIKNKYLCTTYSFLFLSFFLKAKCEPGHVFVRFPLITRCYVAYVTI